MENRSIFLGDSNALDPWHLKVNLDVKAHSTSVIEYPRSKNGYETLVNIIKNILLIASHEEEANGDQRRTLED